MRVVGQNMAYLRCGPNDSGGNEKGDGDHLTSWADALTKALKNANDEANDKIDAFQARPCPNTKSDKCPYKNIETKEGPTPMKVQVIYNERKQRWIATVDVKWYASCTCERTGAKAPVKASHLILSEVDNRFLLPVKEQKQTHVGKQKNRKRGKKT